MEIPEAQIIFPRLLLLRQTQELLESIVTSMPADLVECNISLAYVLNYDSGSTRAVKHLKAYTITGIIRGILAPHPSDSFETIPEEVEIKGVIKPVTKGIQFITEPNRNLLYYQENAPEKVQLWGATRTAVQQYFEEMFKSD